MGSDRISGPQEECGALILNGCEPGCLHLGVWWGVLQRHLSLRLLGKAEAAEGSDHEAAEGGTRGVELDVLPAKGAMKLKQAGKCCAAEPWS